MPPANTLPTFTRRCSDLRLRLAALAAAAAAGGGGAGLHH